jgi:hypothetical protein
MQLRQCRTVMRAGAPWFRLMVLAASAGACLMADRGYVLRGTVRCLPEECGQAGILAGVEVELQVASRRNSPRTVLEIRTTDENGRYSNSVLLPSDVGSRLVAEFRRPGYEVIRVPLFADGKAKVPSCGAPGAGSCFVLDVTMRKASIP